MTYLTNNKVVILLFYFYLRREINQIRRIFNLIYREKD